VNEPIIVCPDEPVLLTRMRGQALVIRTRDPAAIASLAVRTNGTNALHAVWLDSDQPLDDIPIESRWAGVTLVIRCAGIASVKGLSPRMPLLRRLPLRIFIPAHLPSAFVDLHILSSLGISCGLIVDASFDRWQELNDLMHYAVYCKAPHAPIEPFNYVVTHYHPEKMTDFDAAYFNAPGQYLHVNNREEIALTQEDLQSGRILAKGLGALETITTSPAFRKSQYAWRKRFLEMSSCASCPGWRVCLGKYADAVPPTTGCSEFFSDLLDAADFYRRKRDDGRMDECR